MSIMLLACFDEAEQDFVSSSGTQSSSSEVTEMPVMSDKVVSYKKYTGHEYNGTSIGFITEEDILKSTFPHIFEKENKCNYFAISFFNSSISHNYWILSQDMILYQITPGIGKGNLLCSVTEDVVISAMLVCDDTEEGNLKDKIKLDATRSYTDPNWDCRKESENERDVFF
ncbi:MAG: hypothetical protein LBU89_01375 [Fibromonadaceae bacterium]|nr:hypothetical protein [Fibromonadaceae bacterium]